MSPSVPQPVPPARAAASASPRAAIHRVDEENQRIPREEKPPVKDALDAPTGAVAKYNHFFSGGRGVPGMLKYDAAMLISRNVPGAVGYLLRQKAFGWLLRGCGADARWGVSVALRHPGKMTLGDRVSVDDFAMLCARGVEGGGGVGRFEIGDDAVISRFCILQSKRGDLIFGPGSLLGTHSQVVSTNGCRIGARVNTGPQCYLGGSRHGIARDGVPMMDQETHSRGPLVIGDDVWLGAGVRVMEGVRIGRGAVVGAGAVVTRDVPDHAVVAGVPARLLGYRGADGGVHPPEPPVLSPRSPRAEDPSRGRPAGDAAASPVSA
ncbi:acyltransferase [Phycisphaera mikurensis]|uniref:Acyltransferase n=1 Tax=Phycisphaera mikurensis (strain NBRC 102666 / KCTC 22515 / FYK2301M01) TaxID=1142394 RepID=I0IBI4_PHYMF|nr:acyltransferase [Phycisphaera mikurensis]MBB6442847.1 acetyltransferase-like isoleucine patch superfamily enzyme [Phycisphaera mikurensis]BAM02622.1 hypothetical protein PSMK_04630 [Phycisphaera mikurensis NBRC 102666]